MKHATFVGKIGVCQNYNISEIGHEYFFRIMFVTYITTKVCKFDSMQLYMIKLVCDLLQIVCFLLVLLLSPSINLCSHHITELIVESGIKIPITIETSGGSILLCAIYGMEKKKLCI